jgi:hypothetical protein
MIFPDGLVAGYVLYRHLERMWAGLAVFVKDIDKSQPFVVGETKPGAIQFCLEVTQRAEVVFYRKGDA